MATKRPPILIISILIALSLACSLTGSETKPEIPPEDTSQDAIATAVAATIAAAEAESTLTFHPTVTADTPLLPEPTFNYNGVRFYFNTSLADNITAGTTPANLLDGNEFWNTPEHREYVFNNWNLPGGFHNPTIWVYSVADFSAVNPTIGDRLSALQAALAAQSPDGAGLEVASFFNAGQFFQSNVRYLEFQNGTGARWLSQYGQAYFPIGLPSLFYTFQGFTADGAYYISLIMPVDHPILPPTGSVTLDDAFYNNYEVYAVETAQTLNVQTDASFTPSLELLDQLVQTLLVLDPGQ